MIRENDPTTDRAAGRLEQALETARERGVSAAKLHFVQDERAGCGFEAGRLKTADAHRSGAYSIEVVIEGKRASAYGNRLDDLDDMIDRAVTLARSGSVAHFDAYPPPGELHAVKSHSQRTAALTREELIDANGKIVHALKQYNPDLYVSGAGNRVCARHVLVTTGGVRHSRDVTRWDLGCFCQRTEGTDMLFAGYGRAWGDRNEHFDPDAIAGRILEDLRLAERQADPPTGETAVLLAPEMFEGLLRALALGVHGRNVAKGNSPLAGRLGERMFDPAFSLTDNPHADYAPGAKAIDADGVPTRVLPIVREGVLETFLYDLDSAALAGAEPTGNDGCEPHCLQVAPGGKSSEELLAEMTDGLYVKHVMGFGQGNLINGDFSCNVALGYRVRDGEVVGRVKNTMLAGNLYEMLKRNVAPSSDLDPLLSIPHVRLEGATASAAAGSE